MSHLSLRQLSGSQAECSRAEPLSQFAGTWRACSARGPRLQQARCGSALRAGGQLKCAAAEGQPQADTDSCPSAERLLHMLRVRTKQRGDYPAACCNFKEEQSSSQYTKGHGLALSELCILMTRALAHRWARRSAPCRLRSWGRGAPHNPSCASATDGRRCAL